MKKRIGAILLTICMLVGALPTAALAAETRAESPWKLVTPGETEVDQTPYYASIAVKSFEELKRAVETVPDDIQSGYEPTLSIWIASKWNDAFTWPEEGGELTIDFGGDQKATNSCVPRIELYASSTSEDLVTWEIPENVTITCYENMQIASYGNTLHIAVDGALNLYNRIKDSDEKGEITVNGSLSCARSEGDWNPADLSTFSSITVNNGGTLTVEHGKLAKHVIVNQGASVNMGQSSHVYDLTVHSGAEFTHTSDYDWNLYGTLTLDDGVELDAGSVAIALTDGAADAAIVTSGTAILDGDIYLQSLFGGVASLTLQGNLTVGPILVYTSIFETDTSDRGRAVVTIPVGSHVKTPFINEHIHNVASDLTIHAAGTLEFGVNGGTNSWKIGDLVLGETAADGTVTQGTVIMRPSSNLFDDYEDTENPVSSKITGSGTIRMYARVCPDDYWGWGWYPSLFGYNSEKAETDPLYEQGYIADTVTIWRNWDEADSSCVHVWDDGVITREPTETRPGEKVYTCTQCGTEKVENIPVTGAACEHTNTRIINQKDATCGEEGYTGDTYCSDCGNTITYGTAIPATGRHVSSGETDCTKADTCTECGAVIRAAGPHDFGAWTKKDEADHIRTCAVCGTPETGSHTWNSGVITTQPSAEKDGVKTFTCTACGAVRTETVSKLAKQEVYWMPQGPITVTYGRFSYVRPTAYNDTVEDCVFTYTSSNESVATVNEAGKTTIVGAGTAIITATAPAVGNYAATSASYTLTVNKADLTVTAGDKTISYGQAPANGGYDVSGLVNSDTVSVLSGTPAYTYTYEQFGAVGTYAIRVSGLTAANYNIAFQTGTLTVEKAQNYTISFAESQLEQVAGHLTGLTASVEPCDSTAVIKVEYLVNSAWVDTLPADLPAGSYAVRASLTASDNIALDGRFTDGTLVVKNGVTVDPGQGVENVEIGVDVEDGKASLDISDPTQITDKADGDVKIDIGGISGAKELELPADLVTGLSRNEKANSLTVTTEDASVTLSGAVLDTVADAVKSDEDTVTVRLTSVEKEALNDKQQEALDSIGQDAVIVEVSLVITHADGGETELHELGGNTEITVPYDGPVPEGKYIVVSYVSSDGGVSYVRASYNRETRQVTFKTDHFSHYVLFLSGRNAYDLTVVGGSGSGTYLEGSAVTVQAGQKVGWIFTGWTVTSGSLALGDSTGEKITFAMPAGDVTLTANYRAYSFSGAPDNSVKPAQPVRPPQPVAPFVDVTAGDYYFSAVLWAVEQGVTGGTSAATFSPDAACTRAQAVTFLWRAVGSPAPRSSEMPFADVSADAYYSNAVLWAVEQGITAGTSESAFSPDMECTRAQIVTLLWRAQKAAAAGITNLFTDVPHDAYYADAVLWAVEQGITTGTSADTFSPDAWCTRAQIVTFLWRCMGK